MSTAVKTYRTFICTKCKVEVELLGTTEQPAGWVGLVFTEPPLGSFDKSTRYILFSECEQHFAHFLFPEDS